MRKRVLILGAGIYQLPLIRKAKEMGYETIVASILGNYPGIDVCDHFLEINTLDQELILQAAKDYKVSAILTTGTDVAISTIGYVGECLGLRTISQESAKKATNKWLMKEAFKEYGVRTADFRRCETQKEVENFIKDQGLPIILKATDSSGSRGIVKVSRLEELEEAFDYAQKGTKKSYIIVEKFLEGTEIGVDGFVGENGIDFFAPHGKLTFFNGDTDVPVGHYFPLEKELCSELEETMEKGLEALGIKNSFFNADVMVVEDKPYIIEIGARCGATGIPELIKVYTGIDYYEQMIRCSLGEELNWDFHKQEDQVALVKLIISKKTGIITQIELPKEREGYQINLDYALGDCISAFKVGPDRLGQILLWGESTENIKQRLMELEDEIKIQVKL